MATTTAQRGWRRLALPVSILLNLFFVAIIGGHLLNTGYRGASVRSPFTRALARAEAILPPEDAATFRTIMQQEKPRFTEVHQRLANARQELVRQLTAEPYSQDAMREALASWRGEWDSFATAFGDTLADALGRISPEGRRKLADAHWLKRP